MNRNFANFRNFFFIKKFAFGQKKFNQNSIKFLTEKKNSTEFFKNFFNQKIQSSIKFFNEFFKFWKNFAKFEKNFANFFLSKFFFSIQFFEKKINKKKIH